MPENRNDFPDYVTGQPDDRAQRKTPGARALHCSQQSSSRHIQIHQPTGHKQTGGILDQDQVTYLGEAKDLFENQKRMFDLCPHLRFGFVPGFVIIKQRTLAAALLMGKVILLGRLYTVRFTLARIGRIAPDARLIAVKQITQQLSVSVGRGRRDRMNQLGLSADTNMRLHAEVPLVTFLRLMHHRVTGFVLVVGRAGCIDDGRIHNRASVNYQPVFLKIAVDLYKQLIAQIMRFEQMSELADRGLVRCGFTPMVDADEAPHGARVIQGFFHRRIGQIEPVLQKVDAQHAFQADRGAARTFRLWVKRLDHFAQVTPGVNLLHSIEKLLPTGWLTVQLKTFFGEGALMLSVSLQLA